MKITRMVMILIPLVLSSCSTGGSRHRSTSSGSSSSSSHIPSTSGSSTASTSGSSSSSSSSSQPHTGSVNISFTAINDFHGQIDEEGEMVGLAKLTTYLKEKKDAGNILINSGDMYQGSFLCNYDKGKFLSSAFKEIGFDSYTIGNHEFDWGVNPILENEAALGQHFLGANIYKYPKGSEWEKSDLGESYKIVEHDGVRIGIIGVIGEAQIGSITSTFVEDYIFLNPTPIVKSIALDLRENQGCDIVVLSSHNGGADESLSELVPDKSYRYIDACFLAHTHQFDYQLVNGVPYLQAGAYSQGASNVTLKYDFNTKAVSHVSSGNTALIDLNLAADPEMAAKIETEKNKNIDKYTDIIGHNNTGYTINTGNMAKYYARLTYDAARSEQPSYDVKGVIFNYARRSLKEGDFTYADLFETHPFLNDIYILSVRKDQIDSEKAYNYGYFNSDTLSSGEYYDVAVYNYIGFHIGIDEEYNKYYNYFSTAFSAYAEHPPIKLSFNCFDLALNHLSSHPEINTSDFTGEGFFGGLY